MREAGSRTSTEPDGGARCEGFRHTTYDTWAGERQPASEFVKPCRDLGQIQAAIMHVAASTVFPIGVTFVADDKATAMAVFGWA